MPEKRLNERFTKTEMGPHYAEERNVPIFSYCFDKTAADRSGHIRVEQFP